MSEQFSERPPDSGVDKHQEVTRPERTERETLPPRGPESGSNSGHGDARSARPAVEEQSTAADKMPKAGSGEKPRLSDSGAGPAPGQLTGGPDQPRLETSPGKGAPGSVPAGQDNAAGGTGMSSRLAADVAGAAHDKKPAGETQPGAGATDKRTDVQIEKELERRTGKSYGELVLSLGHGPIAITPRELESKLLENGTIRPVLPDNSKHTVIDNVTQQHPTNADRYVTVGVVNRPETVDAMKKAGAEEVRARALSGVMEGLGAQRGSASEGIVSPRPGPVPPDDQRWGGTVVPLGKPSSINESPAAARLGPERIVGGANPDAQGGIRTSIRPSIGEARAYDWATRGLHEKGLERPEHVNAGGRGDFITSRDDGKGGLQILVTDVKTVNPDTQDPSLKTKAEIPDTWNKQVANAIERMPASDPDKGRLQQAFDDGNIVLRNVMVDYRPQATVGRDSAPVSVISESPAKH